MVREDYGDYISKTLPWAKRRALKQDLGWLKKIVETPNHPSLLYSDSGTHLLVRHPYNYRFRID